MPGFVDQVKQLFNPSSPQNQPNPQQQTTATQQQSGATGNVPGQANQVPQGSNDPNNQQSPLDAYADLFKPQDPTKAQSTHPEAPKFALDPKIVDQAASGMDFIAQLPPEIQEKIRSGDPSALMEAINHVGRNSYKAAITHMSSLTDRFVDLRSKHDQTNLGSAVQNHLIRNTVDTQFANANPVARDSLKWVSDKMREAFPDATPAWIAEQAPKFFVEMAKAIDPKAFQQQAAPNQQGQNNGGVNWGDWLLEAPQQQQAVQ